MKYTFICPKCKKEKVVSCSMSEISGRTEHCDDCQEIMNRKWSVNLIVPDDMKADNIVEMGWVNSRLKNLPSGKTRAIY